MNEDVNNLSRRKIFCDVKLAFGKRWSHFLIAFVFTITQSKRWAQKMKNEDS